MKATHTYPIEYKADGLKTYINASDWHSYKFDLKFLEYEYKFLFVATNEQTGDYETKEAKACNKDTFKRYIREFLKNH